MMRGFIISLMFVTLVCGDDLTERNKIERVKEFPKKRGPPAGNIGKEAKPLIVGGKPASPGEYPWVVSIHYDGKYRCAGSIYNADTIITTANCVFGDREQKYARYIIKAGDFKLKVEESTEQEVIVSEIKTHPRYKPWAIRNDIAVLKLEKCLVMNAFVQSIKIPANWKDELLITGDQCVLTGWGWNDFPDSTYTRKLNEVKLPFYDRESCSDDLEKYGVKLSNRHFCTKSTGKGGCNGDGGAPFVCYDKTNEPYLVGAYSIREVSDCFAGFNIFTRMSRYSKWIVEAIE